MNSKYFHKFFILCSLLVIQTTVFGQDTSTKIPVVDVIKQMEQQHQVQFNYESDILNDIVVSPIPATLSLEEKLKLIQSQTSLMFSKVGGSIYSIYRTLRLCGYIKDIETQNALSDATIQSDISSNVTNDEGYFEIRIRSITSMITIRHLGYKTVEREARYFNTTDCGIIFLREESLTITPVVLNSYIVQGINKLSDGSTQLNFNEFSLLPGLIEADVLQSVQALPSIQSIDETVSNINIHGGSNDQNLILWDGIKMYQSGHFFGLISSFHPQITKTASIVNNGTDVAYTDGVSGTIHMKTERTIQPTFKGNVGLNFLSADAFLDIPIGNRSSLQVAGRRSIDDIIRTPTYDTYFNRVTQETEVALNESNTSNSNQDFNFYDTSLRWIYQLSEKDRIRLNFILINNDLTFDETAVLNTVTETRRSSISQNSIAGGISYQRQWNDQWLTELDIYETDYKLKAINANIIQDQRFLQENIVSETGARVNTFYQMNDHWEFNGGYNFIETGVTNLNDIDAPRFRRLNSDVVRTHAGFVQANYKSRYSDLNIKFGGRLNYIDKFSVFIAEPRLNVRKQLGEHFQIELIGEFKHQNTSQIINFQNDFLGVEKRRWQLTDNDSIPILKSKQLAFGISYKNKGWLIDTQAYYKAVDGITAQSQGFTTKYEFDRATGEYDVTGIDVLLRKRVNDITAWLSYSFMDNTYRFDSLEDIEFTSNFDITHAISVGCTYSDKNIDASVGLNYRTGNPTSEPLNDNAILDNTIVYSEANVTRLEDYYRLDASLIWKWDISNAIHSEIGASVWNILNRENFINNYYRIQNDTINEFSRFSLGTTANFVCRVYF